jgi:hypothetical protein
MKRLTYCMILIYFFPTTRAFAQVPFTAGNIVVFRVGDGSALPGSNTTACFIDEYTTTGTLVQSVPLPTSQSGSNNILTVQGNAVFEGMMNLSVDRRFLVVAGYSAPVGTASIAGTLSTTWPRVVGLISYNGIINTSTALTDYSSAGRPTSAITTNGTDIWTAGSGTSATGGPRYTTVGSTTSVQLAAPLSSTTNNNCIGIAGGQLFVSRTSSELILGSVGTGLPTTGGQTVTNLPGLPISGTLGQFVFADMDPGIAGVDVLYVANANASTGGLYKYSLVGGNWTQNGIIGSGADAFRGLTAVITGSTVTLYAVRTANQIVTLTDASGYNAAFGGTPTLLISAGSNTFLRGISLSPAFVALPVKLIMFNAEKVHNDVVINWIVSEETNFSHYELERSTDGNTFEKAGRVESLWQNNQTAYTYRDSSIISRVNVPVILYRLKMVDKDGRYAYSRIAVVRREGETKLSFKVFPNPSQGDLFLHFSLPTFSVVDLQIVNSVGSVLFTKQIALPAGESILSNSILTAHAPGLYMIRTVIDGRVTSAKIIRR